MRSKTIPTLICAALLLGAISAAACAESQASKITRELVKDNILLCHTGNAQQSASAFEFLYRNRALVFPILTEMRESGTEQERAWAATAEIYLLKEEIRRLQETSRTQESLSEKNSEILKNLTNYQLKDTHFYTAVALSVILFGVIIDLVRRKLLRIEYSWVWMLTGAAVLALISTGLLQMIALLIGARVPQTLFFAGVSFLTMIALHYSVAISKLTNQVKNLSQELAVLKHETEEIANPDTASKQE